MTVYQHSHFIFCCDTCRPSLYYIAPKATLFTSCCPCLTAPYGMKREAGGGSYSVCHTREYCMPKPFSKTSTGCPLPQEENVLNERAEDSTNFS